MSLIRITALCGLLLCLDSVPARAQSAAASEAPPDMVVVKYGWTKARIGWERDPFSGTTESFGDMRRRAADDRRRERAQAAGNIAEANKIEREARAEQVLKSRPPAPPRYAFVYKVRVKNTGLKAIREFDWDYVFFDEVTKLEIGRRQFTSSDKIDPGKGKELSFFIASPPTKTISIYALDKKERTNLGELVCVNSNLIR